MTTLIRNLRDPGEGEDDGGGVPPDPTHPKPPPTQE